MAHISPTLCRMDFLRSGSRFCLDPTGSEVLMSRLLRVRWLLFSFLSILLGFGSLSMDPLLVFTESAVCLQEVLLLSPKGLMVFR